MAEIMFKYRIDELLNILSVTSYRKAIRIIPQQLNISQKTFANYRNIKLSDIQDIPHTKVVILEKLFALKPGELQNFELNIEPLTEFLR